MRIAVPFEPDTGMVAEHFGHAAHFRFYDYVEEEMTVYTQDTDSPANGHDGVTAFLADNNIQVVLCCNLGEGARDALFERNIAVLAGVAGPADDLVIALLENRLRYTSEATCGCHHEGGECGCGCGCGDESSDACECGCGCH